MKAPQALGDGVGGLAFCMSGGRGWITSRMPPGWTATSSALSWSPPGSARLPSTR